MGFRLSKIYTKTGDKKITKTATNQEVFKDHPKITLNGELDELNSYIGVIRSFLDQNQKKIDDILLDVQHQLFDFGGEITFPQYQKINEHSVLFLEKHIDEINENLPPLKEFILPGGTKSASFCHLARTVCRRVERYLVTLSRTEKLSECLFSYINRLSDLLFVIARFLNLSDKNNIQEIYWKSERLNKASCD